MDNKTLRVHLQQQPGNERKETGSAKCLLKANKICVHGTDSYQRIDIISHPDIINHLIYCEY